MSATVSIPKNEYDELLRKANLLNNIMDTENLSDEELERLNKARMGASISENEFLSRHPELK